MYLVTQMTTKQVQRRRQEQPWRLFCVSFLLFFVALLPGVVWSGLFQSTTCSLISLLSSFSSRCVLNWTRACLYTHTGTHTPTCIYTHIHTDAHTHTHALTHRHRHKHTHTHMHMHTIMHTDTHRHTQAHTLSHKQTHTITHTHTHTNIRTHIPLPPLFFFLLIFGYYSTSRTTTRSLSSPSNKRQGMAATKL